MVICSRSSARRSSDSSVTRSLWRARIEGLNTSMRSPPMRLAWYIASSASLSTSSARLTVSQRDPNRSGEKQLAVVEGDGRTQSFAQRLGKVDDALGFPLRQQNESKLVARESRKGVLRLQQPSEPPRQRQQNRIADRDANGIVDLLEAVEIDHDHGRLDRGIGLGEGEHAF